MSELRPCPWNCKRAIEIKRMFGSERYSLLHYCLVVGPISFTEETAEACAAAWNHRPVEDALVDALTKARRWIVEDKFQHDNHCAFICNGGPPCDCPVPVIDAALKLAKERQNG